MARRVLDRPPSARYGVGGEVAPRSGDAGGPADGVVASRGGRAAGGLRPELSAILASALTAAVLVILGGLLGVIVGQLFVAGVGGGVIGLLLAGSSRSTATKRRWAIGLAAAAAAVGAIGGWLIALSEGGALGLLDYTWATSGLLVPVELVVASIAAAWGVRAGPIVD